MLVKKIEYLFAAVLVLAIAYLAAKKFQIVASTPNSHERTAPLLASQSDVGIYKNLSGKDRKALKDLVLNFCVRSYDEASCFHYFTTCGSECEALLSRDQKAKIISYYLKLKKQESERKAR